MDRVKSNFLAVILFIPVMRATLGNLYLTVFNTVNKAVTIINSSTPKPLEFISQRLWLADAIIAVAVNVL